MSTYKTDITHASLETLERRHIKRVLKAKNGNLSKAAQVLGIDRRTLYRKLDKYAREYRAKVFTIDYVSAYPASLTEGASSTAIKLLDSPYGGGREE